MSVMVTCVTLISGGAALIGEELERADVATVSIEGELIAAIDTSGTHDGIDATGLTLIPGFIDTHVHIGFHSPASVLTGGVTTVRDLAWPPELIFPMVERSMAAGSDGPRILAAGPMLTVAGGYPTRAGWAPEGTGRVVSSHDEAEAAVEEVADAGAAIVKVALNAQVGPTLDLDTLAAIVSAAHDRGLKVTGHVFGLEELHKALDAGMDELAHMLMSPETIPDETIARMVEAGMAVVPTLSVRYGKDRKIAIENLRRFSEAGGTIAYGTDLGNQGPQPGIDKREIKAMAAAGLTGRDIVASGTTRAARWLGLDGTGVLATGARADIVGVKGDPLTDPMALTKVKLVVRGGRVVKAPR
jgi:imidazolonepropionase-like amidohydrolase